MATVRLYRPNGATVGGALGFTLQSRSGWTSLATTTQANLVTDKNLGSNGISLQFGGTPAIGTTEQLRLMVTQPLSQRIVLNTIRGCWATGVGSSAANKNWGFALHVWATVGSTNELRGVVVNQYKQASSAGQWLDSGSDTIGRTIPDIPCNPVILQAGDLLVVELGVVYYETGGSALDSLGTRDSGGSVLDDITPGDAGDSHAVWIEYESEDVIIDTPTPPPFEDGEISIPITHITVTLKDGTAQPFAEVDLNDRDEYYDGYKRPWVQEFHAISRGLSDHRGQGESLSFGARFSDAAERYWRELLEDSTSPANRVLRGRPLEVWIIGDEERRAEELQRLIAAGFVTEYSLEPNLQFELKGGGWLDWKFSRLRNGAQAWQPLIYDDDFGSNTDFDDHLAETPCPVWYGWLNAGGSIRPGLVPTIYTGIRDGLHEFLVGRLAYKEIEALFVDNAPIGAGELSANWYVPTDANWTGTFGSDPYRDFNGRRYTVIYAETGQAVPDAIAAGESLLTVNLKGVEDVGDGSGDLILSGVDQLKHFLTYFCARPDPSVDESPYPATSDYTFPHIPGLPLIDEDSFTTAKGDLADRLGLASPQDDYHAKGGVGNDGESLDAYEAIARWCVAVDVDWYYNRRGQFALSVEPIATVSAVGDITDVLTIVHDSFTIRDDHTLHFNVLPFRAGRVFGDRKSIGGWSRWGTERAEESIDEYEQELDCPAFEFHMGGWGNATYSHIRTTLLDAMRRKRCRFQHPLRKATFEGPLSLLAYEVGDIVTVTHVEGTGSNGWEGRHVRIIRHEVFPTVGRVRIECYDIEPIWTANSAAGSP